MGLFINVTVFFCFLSALAVVTLRNPVHSILCLVFSFFIGGLMLISIGAEFLGLMVLIVYVGAIAVLFLFVVMMLNINLESSNEGTGLFLVGSGVAVLLLSLVLFLMPSTESVYVQPLFENIKIDLLLLFDSMTTLETLGQVLYTDFFVLLLLAGLILLIALVGSVVLTLQTRHGVKKQLIHTQRSRCFESSVCKVSFKK